MRDYIVTPAVAGNGSATLGTLFLQKKFKIKHKIRLGNQTDFLRIKAFARKVNNIGQTVGINHEGKGFGQNDDGHVALETHLGQGSQHTEKVSWANGPNHHKIKKRSKRLPLSSQPMYLS